MISSFFNSLIFFYKNLNKNQKYFILWAIKASIVLIFLLIIFSIYFKNTKKNYSILFENLNSQDSALIVQYLEKKHIPYEIIDKNIIKVPSKMLQKLRLDIAAQGLPKSSTVSFEFDRNLLNISDDFGKKVRYLQIIEKKLEEVVESIKAVESANVNIALEKGVVPTASVLIKLKENMILTPKQIRGIKNLVAAAVPKLTPKNVKIIDQYGNPLGESDELTKSNELLKTQIIYQKRLEKMLEDKIVSILAPVVGGNDKVVAKVNVDLDFSQVKMKSIIYDPDNVVKNEKIVEESRISKNPNPEINNKSVKKIKTPNTFDKYNKSETTTNYKVSTIIKNIKKPLAKINRITAAVVVDGHYKKNKNGRIIFIPLSKIEIVNIENLVKNAIGFDPKRGDSVSVSSFPFHNYHYQNSKLLLKKSTSIIDWSRILNFLIIFIIGFIFLLIIIFRNKILKINKQSSIKKEININQNEIDTTYDKIKKSKEEPPKNSLNKNDKELEYEVWLKKVKEMVEDNPEQIAKLLEDLLEEEKKGL